jgi:hypothetical protein
MLRCQVAPTHNKRNMIPPNEIDDAQLIAYLVLDENKHQRTGNTQHFVDGSLTANFHGLAICSYEGSDGYYLFYCDSSWESVTDTYHDTIADAKDQAEFEYSNTENDWVSVA